MHKGRWLRIAAACGVLVALFFLLGGRDDTRARKRANADEAREESHAASTEPTAPEPAVGPTDVAALAARVTSVERLRENLERYEAESMYPTWSRPLDREDRYKLAWNEPVTSELPFDDRPGQETTYRFGADRAHVMAGEALTTFIEVIRLRDRERVEIDVPTAFVVSLSGAAPGRSVSLSYHDDGKDGDEVAGDRRYTNRFVPSSEESLRTAQQVHIRAIVRHDGIERAMVRDFTYAPRLLVNVHGVSDAAEEGNLVVRLDATVAEAGTYTFEANLLGNDDEPLAYADVSVTLGAGRTTVKLPFFGRILHDKGAAGPYRVKDIRGMRRSLGGAEDDIRFHVAVTHTTRPYELDAFSKAAWDSPEKRESIASMRQLLEQTERGELARLPSKHLHIGSDGIAREIR
jgi:hypothetical protein